MDKYDEQIARLTADPKLIISEWENAEGIFNYIGELGKDMNTGCLTQIRCSSTACKAYIKGEIDETLTDKIHRDTRLPNTSAAITVDNLAVFAEWRRHIDSLENTQP